MGDMKTPDFEDLLAAFDIPDMVDPKAAIDSNHSDGLEKHLKRSPCESNSTEQEAHNSNAHDIGISVIVKNIRNIDPIKNAVTLSGNNKELFTKAVVHSVSNVILPNQSKSLFCPKTGCKTAKRITVAKHCHQLSPIFSAEEKEVERKVDVADPEDRKATSKKVPNKEKQDRNTNSIRCLSPPSNGTRQTPNKTILSFRDFKEALGAGNECYDNMKVESSTSVLAALGTTKGRFTDGDKNAVNNQKQSGENVNNSMDLAEDEPTSDTAKRNLSRVADSPACATSDGSKCSLASSTDALAIPKVRIKTIKTSSGQIKRTVSRVLPEFDLDGWKNDDLSDGQTTVATSTMATSPTRSHLPGTFSEMPKQMTMKPVATAFLPVSAVKTVGSQVISLKLANNTTVKATVIPASSVQGASGTILKAANAIQQPTIVVPASSLANTKLVPKAVHLSNILKQVKQQPVQTKPFSKKVSKIQLINSSKGTVVDAFNKVLSSINPVPVYIPNLSPPTSTDISIPSRGYKCLECGDSFALEKSLSQHYERRSVRIEISCSHCSKGLVFYNKCSLLSHARGHKDKGSVMQCSHLILKPIPTDQMIQQTTTPPGHPGIFDSIDASAAQASTVHGKALISAPSSVQVGTVIPEEGQALKSNQICLKCSECDKKFQDTSTLALHYQQMLDASGQKSCSSCYMLLPNPCSLLSHQRIHQHKAPYICPECGTICQSPHFQCHLTKECFHYARRVGYRCIDCSMIFADAASLKSHIQSSHCEVFYKCPLCPMAFKSTPGTHSHVHTQHPGVKAGEPKSIYKCSMCDTVFTQQSLLFTHFDQHIANHTVPVFKCPECSIYYAQRQVMLEHVKAIHRTPKTMDGPSNVGVFNPLSSITTNSNSSQGNNSPSRNIDKDVGKVTCQKKEDKKQKIPDADGKEVRKTTRYKCGECNASFSSKDTFVAHMKREHNKMLKKHPCRQCEKSFNSSHSLCRHNRIKHRGLRKVCPPVQTITKGAELDLQTLMMHSHPEKKTNDSPDEMLTQHKETAGSPKRKQEEESLTLNIRDSQPLKKLKVNIPKIHKCAVCSFSSEDIIAFHKHIPQHKTNGSSFQCLECGLCYTSPRSLARHLFIVHRLKEPRGLRHNDDESQRENTLDVTDENDGKPNTKCKVCGKVFETDVNLNIHMRTHGMAFIKAKRLNAADREKNP